MWNQEQHMKQSFSKCKTEDTEQVKQFMTASEQNYKFIRAGQIKPTPNCYKTKVKHSAAILTCVRVYLSSQQKEQTVRDRANVH